MPQAADVHHRIAIAAEQHRLARRADHRPVIERAGQPGRRLPPQNQQGEGRPPAGQGHHKVHLRQTRRAWIGANPMNPPVRARLLDGPLQFGRQWGSRLPGSNQRLPVRAQDQHTVKLKTDRHVPQLAQRAGVQPALNRGAPVLLVMHKDRTVGDQLGMSQRLLDAIGQLPGLQPDQGPQSGRLLILVPVIALGQPDQGQSDNGDDQQPPGRAHARQAFQTSPDRRFRFSHGSSTSWHPE